MHRSEPDVDALARARPLIAARAAEPGALLPILHDVQDALGFVPAALVPEIAEALNLSRAEVHGVVTYYHHFRDAPPAARVVRLCQAESCKAMGADALRAHAEERLGTVLGGRSADGTIDLEPVYCLGLCAVSPAMAIDDAVHGRVTPARFDRLVAAT